MLSNNNIIISLVIILISYIFTLFINVEPYMDEIFHIPQSQSFCNNDFTYNSKITTFPGLYLISYILLSIPNQIFHGILYNNDYFQKDILCSIYFLRGINILISILSLMLYRLCRIKVKYSLLYY
jgi:hypothetical protein